MDEVSIPTQLTRPVLDALQRGATIVTANQRAARTVRRAYDILHHRRGEATWLPSAVYAWDTWLARLWETMLLEGASTEILLSDLQEHSIWRSILREDAGRVEFLHSVDSLAELSANGWRTISQHCATKRLPAYAHTQETRSFFRWANEFQRRCSNHGWISSSILEDKLEAALRSGALRVTGEVALLGFDELLPSRKRLLEALQAAEVSITDLTNEKEDRSCELVHTPEERDEMEAAARWASDILTRVPEAVVAVVAPNLEAKRMAISRTFRHVLAPALENIERPNHAVPYEFSVGTRLADTPLVQVGLELLHWAHGPLLVDRVSALLVSPLFAMERNDGGPRAIFDAMELRRAKFLRPEISIRWTVDLMRRSRRPQPTRLLGALRAMEASAERWKIAESVRSYADWAGAIRAILAAAQWGRETGGDSVEFQTSRRWEATLDQLATLDFAGKKADFASILQELERLARITVFAPESRETPVQILGPLETAGSHFDAVWFLGAGDLTWPVRPAMNPLLPRSLQAELGVPGADPMVDDARGRRLARRVADSAKTVVFSYASELEAGRQRPSAALKDLSLSKAPIDTSAWVPSAISATSLEEFADTAVIPPPERIMQGGAEILRLQAACGFRAFAEKRLFADELKSIELGMDASERGNVVHRTLEHFWNEVKSQETLKSMPHALRNETLHRAIDHGLHKALQATVTAWDEAYVEVQRRRLFSLIDAWLSIELKRDPFDVRLSEKEFKDVAIGPLRLGVRVDRIDATPEGNVIIDYKTGRARSSDWLGTRPDAPQLPLYAVLASELEPESKLADVAFAVVRAGNQAVLDTCTRKITREVSKPLRRPIPVTEQLTTWRGVLHDLAIRFHSGDASVDPKSYPQTCTYCAHRTLCRLNPEELNFEEDLDEQTEDDSTK